MEETIKALRSVDCKAKIVVGGAVLTQDIANEIGADYYSSDALDLVHGYPDGSFKPNQAILRSECTAVISHITKDLDVDTEIVNRFTDVSSIPNWAVDEYAKSLTYGIYVNHPDPNMLEPNRALTRAEAAKILSVYMGL